MDERCHTLLALGHALQQLHYRFVTVTPVSQQRVNARPAAQRAHTLRDILGWNRPFDAARAAALHPLLLSDHVSEICADGRRARLRVSSLGDLLFFHSAFPTTEQNAVFFGPDTMRFIRALQTALPPADSTVRRAVDIGCGAGPGAITLARHFPLAEVIAVDINPEALTLTSINAQLAGVPQLKMVQSNLLTALDGRFDLIASNPPYLLDPAGRAYRHGGGLLGAGLSLAIVESALERLEPGGRLLLYTGVAIVDGVDGFLQAITPLLQQACSAWSYEELDPDVFGEELDEPHHAAVERFAAVWLQARKKPAHGQDQLPP